MASEKILAMIEEVKGLSVLELNELVKALEEEFGVSAAAVAAPAAGAAATAAVTPNSSWIASTSSESSRTESFLISSTKFIIFSEAMIKISFLLNNFSGQSPFVKRHINYAASLSLSTTA